MKPPNHVPPHTKTQQSLFFVLLRQKKVTISGSQIIRTPMIHPVTCRKPNERLPDIHDRRRELVHKWPLDRRCMERSRRAHLDTLAWARGIFFLAAFKGAIESRLAWNFLGLRLPFCAILLTVYRSQRYCDSF